MKLYLVRHGSSTGNTPGTLIGHSDHPLTEAGIAQARAVAARLAPLGPMPVYCSDLLRAHQTAEYISMAWASAGTSPDGDAGGEPLLYDDARLRELDIGVFGGRSWDDFLADEELNEAMIADPLHTALPGGESLAQLRDRVLAAIDDIVGRHALGPAAGEATLRGSVPAGALAGQSTAAVACVVAHDGPIRTILNHVLGVLPAKWWALTTTHGGLSLLEWSDGWVNVRFINDTSHLEGPAWSVSPLGTPS